MPIPGVFGAGGEILPRADAFLPSVSSGSGGRHSLARAPADLEQIGSFDMIEQTDCRVVTANA